MMQRFFVGYSTDVAQHRFYSNGDTVGYGLGYKFRNLFNTGLTVNPSRTQGLYQNDDGTIEMTGVYIGTVVDYWTVGRDSLYSYTYKSNDTYNVAMSVFLVSDGGTTLSSINDPSLNINNPNAPINQVDVPVAGFFGGAMLLSLMSFRRKIRKSHKR